jgi:uncharacterized protein (TIGR04255 family)
MQNAPYGRRTKPAPSQRLKLTNFPPYRRPPVIEAVIDIQFSDALGQRDLERIREKFKKRYPVAAARQNVEVLFGPHGAAAKASPVGYQLTSGDGVDIVLVQINGITTSRLPPYPGWEQLFERATDNYSRFTKVAGRRAITRVATKFVNRIDIPVEKLNGRQVSDFVTIGIGIPDGIAESVSTYSMTATFIDFVSKYLVMIETGMAPQALLEHISFDFNIDVSLAQQIPLKMDDVWDVIAQFRAVKNRIFEESITDALREIMR